MALNIRKSISWGTPLAIVAALVASLLVATPAGAAGAAPTDLAPSAGGSASPSPTLRWSRVTAATRYEVQVSASSSFTPLLYSSSTTNRQAVPTVLLPAGANFWRVRGVFPSGAGDWATESFTVDSTASPQPATPQHDALLPQPETPPLLSWSTVAGATGYQVEVDTDQDFIGASPYTTKTTSLVVPDPKAGGTYWWRVRAQLSNNLYTSYSDPWTYRIGALPEVEIVFPSDGENTSVEDVVLEWKPVLGAKTYDLLVSTDQDFNTIVDSKTDIKGTRYSPATTYLNDQYYWKVRAKNNLAQTIDWADVAVHNFRRQWPQQPVLQYPANALSPAVGGDFYYQWTPVPHASRYQLDVGTDPNFSPTTFKSCFTTATTYTAGVTSASGGSADGCWPGQGVTTYWRVRALDDPAPGGVQGIYSAVHKFIYDSGRVSQVSPSNGASVAVPTLTWQAVRGAEKYKVIVTGQGGSPRIETDTYALSWTPTGTKPLDPAKSPYTWTVQSIGANKSVSPLPAGRTFSIAGTAPTTGAGPLEPINGDGGAPTTRFPNLSWEPITDAAYYRLDIGLSDTGYWLPTNQSPILTDSFPYPTATDEGKGILSPGSYDWRVRAYNSTGGLLETSPHLGRFTIADLDDVGGQQIALSGKSLDADQACKAYLMAPAPDATKCIDVPATPVLDWAPVPEASHYMVYVAQDRELTNRVYTGISTVNTRWTPDWDDQPSALPDSQAGQAYYWLIRPCKAINVCAPDPISTNEVADHAFNKKSPAVELLTPAQDAVVPTVSEGTPGSVSFTWRDYLTTNGGSVFEYSPGIGEAGPQAGRQYRIQVSQSESFATTIDNKVVDQTTYTPFATTYPEGTLYWRVQAIDGDSNSLTWSPPRRFVKSSPAPALSAPINNAPTNGVRPFEWEPTAFAGSYQLEVYKDNDTSLSPVNRVVNVTSKQTAYAHSSPLPVSTKPYLWRVARLDADGRPGQWSPVQSFLSDGSAPTLTTPAADAEINGHSAYFAWNAVMGAVSYKFERKVFGGSVAETVTTSAQAWAPTSVIATGKWSWQVTALDANKSAIGSSGWRDVTVDNVKGTFTPVSPNRILDTRIGLGASKRQVGPGQTITVTVPGLSASTTAVTMNVTVTRPTSGGHLIVFPGGQPKPTTSNLNFKKGQTIANLVTVTVGTGGKVSFFNYAGSVDVVADLEGYFRPDAGSGYTGLNPARVLDTRIGLGAPKARLGASRSVTLTVPGLPSDAVAVALNVTATKPSSSGYLTAYPGGQSRPTASNVNFAKDQTIANMVVVGVGAGGTVTITNAYGTVDVVADLSGYYSPDKGAAFKGQAPKRVLDTRIGLGAPKAMVEASGTITVTVPGLPVGTTAVALNVTATQPTTSSYTTVFPTGEVRTSASNVNYVRNETIPNMVMVSVGAGGKINLFNAYGKVHLIADVAGFYTSPTS